MGFFDSFQPAYNFGKTLKKIAESKGISLKNDYGLKKEDYLAITSELYNYPYSPANKVIESVCISQGKLKPMPQEELENNYLGSYYKGEDGYQKYLESFESSNKESIKDLAYHCSMTAWIESGYNLDSWRLGKSENAHRILNDIFGK